MTNFSYARAALIAVVCASLTQAIACSDDEKPVSVKLANCAPFKKKIKESVLYRVTLLSQAPSDFASRKKDPAFSLGGTLDDKKGTWLFLHDSDPLCSEEMETFKRCEVYIAGKKTDKPVVECKSHNKFYELAKYTVQYGN